MFKVFVRPILEYASPVWAPGQMRDIEALESVQRRFTSRLPGLGSLGYLPRLIACNLEPLELRRIKADLVFMYKIMHGLVDVPVHALFTLLPVSSTRSHSQRVSVPLPRTVTRANTFAPRICKIWNSLQENTVNAASAQQFVTCLNNENLEQFLRARQLNA